MIEDIDINFWIPHIHVNMNTHTHGMDSAKCYEGNETGKRDWERWKEGLARVVGDGLCDGMIFGQGGREGRRDGYCCLQVKHKHVQSLSWNQRIAKRSMGLKQGTRVEMRSEKDWGLVMPVDK